VIVNTNDYNKIKLYNMVLIGTLDGYPLITRQVTFKVNIYDSCDQVYIQVP
jgi:hypothetical protein